MSVRDEVIGIMRSQATRSIRFSFTTVTSSSVSVDASTFERVATAIESGQITVTDDTSRLDAGADAQYEGTGGGDNVFVVPPTRHRRYQEAVVVHEAVHASIDVTRSTIPRIDNEVAAYIAGTIYLRRTGFSRHRYRGTYEEISLAAVNAILRDGSATTEQINGIRRALQGDAEYNTAIRWGCPVRDSTCYYIDIGNG